MRALTAPGQGAQRPGMLLGWLDTPGVAEQLADWSALIDLDLIELGTSAPAEAIADTRVTQPLLTAAALISFQTVDAPFDRVAGHSVGE
ncbi:MAG: hypothetical protein LBO20_00185, partial [Bifidobacteriaceae bacterium]|nr:hypothetical protein [Bifidobacteriaceae bacterium]